MSLSSDNSTGPKDLLDLLAGEDRWDRLIDCVKIIVGRGQKENFPKAVWDYPVVRSLEKDAKTKKEKAIEDDVINDVLDRFVAFLRGHSESLLAYLAADPSRTQSAEETWITLVDRYMSRLRDESRKREVSAYRYACASFRKHLSKTKARAEGIFYRSERTCSYYGLEEVAGTLQKLAGVLNEPYGRWASPLALVPYERMLQEIRFPDAVNLAKAFWEEAREKLGRAWYLPIWELVVFLSCHYDYLRDTDSDESLDQLNDEWGGARIADANTAAPDSRIDALDPQALTALVDAWTPETRQVVVFVLDDPEAFAAAGSRLFGESHVRWQKPFQQVADQVGLSDARRAWNCWQEAMASLSDLIREHASAGTMNRELFDVRAFQEWLRGLCEPDAVEKSARVGGKSSRETVKR